VTFDAANGAADEAEPIIADMSPSAEDALRALAERGELTPARVVEDAADEASPLHSYFEWDDEKAAHAHRFAQARALIRRVRVEVTVHEHVFRVPAYVHDPTRDKTGGYVATTKLVNQRETALRVLRQEVARAHSCLERARSVAIALGMSATVEALIGQISAAQEEIEVETAKAA
jgi:hypothetical protein